MSRKPVEGDLQILEDLLLSWRLPVFAKRARRRVTAHPKFYWFDCGVYQSVRPRGPLDRPEEIAGGALEGLVGQHLKAWMELTDPSHTLSFWRTPAGTEVDFVVYGPDTFDTIEVKHSTSLRARDLQDCVNGGFLRSTTSDDSGFVPVAGRETQDQRSASGSSVRWQGPGQLAASEPGSNDRTVTMQPQHPPSLPGPAVAAR